MHAAYFTTICKRFCHISTLLSKAKPSIFCRNITNFPVKPIDFDSIEPSSEEVSTGHFFSILKECDSPDDLQKGRIVHAQIIVNGIDDMGLLSTRVLGMYVLCGSITDAKNLFFRLERGVPLPSWNWLIRGFTMMGLFEFALLFYFKMFFSGVWPDRYTFRYVIKACCGLSAVGLGRLVHETIRVMGLELDIFVGSSLIKMYTDNGSIVEAREVFDQLPERDCVLWNVMVHGYVKKGDMRKTIELFNRMGNSNEKPNYVTFSCVLSICASEAIVGCGTQLHGLTIKYGLEFVPSVANTLLAMYTKCRCWSDACKFFDMMPQTDLVTWNGLISGYVQNGMKEEALDSFYKMQSVGVKPDSVTLASILPSFSASARLKQGKEIHAYIVRNDVCLDAFLKSALIDIYFKCKDVDMACRIFHATELMDVVICSAMISGFVLNGMSSNALDMFRLLLQVQMRPNAITVTSVLPACSCLTTLRLGKELHCYALKNAFEGRCYVGSALIDMYAKCGRLDLGHQIFVKLSERDAVAWNSMIVSFTQNGQPQVAINLFRQMGLEGLRYDCATISTILSACASIPALQYGKEIHGFMMRGAFKSDVYAESALIDMYAKCGGLVFARRIFDSMQEKNEVSWNSIIAAYGTYGNVKDAAILFKEMNEAGFQPDHITFLTLISACGHAGKVEEGFRYFRRMNEEYGIVAHMEHYACMVDLFGRAGRLDEALCIIRSMPIEPDAGIWGAMLGACRVHGNVELAELASKHLFELDPQNSGYYVLLSHINAGSGHWERVLKVRSLMKERKVQKLPGCSWIEISNTSHMFIAADQSHPDSTLIYLLLKKLLLELREEGYVPQVDLTYPPPMDSHKQLLKI